MEFEEPFYCVVEGNTVQVCIIANGILETDVALSVDLMAIPNSAGKRRICERVAFTLQSNVH